MKKLFLLFVALALNLIVNAQETILTSGGEILGNEGIVSYSVGQIVFSSNNTPNGSVSQGIQQPYEISIVNKIENTEFINLFATVFPNPTTDYIILKIDNKEQINISYKLYNFDGEILENKVISGFETKITMSNYQPSVYFISIIKDNKNIKTFKIIKNRRI